MLILKPNCEWCNHDLPPECNDAFICTFECTFCEECCRHILNFVCPNCTGNLVNRPIRPMSALEKYPASTKRVHKKST